MADDIDPTDHDRAAFERERRAFTQHIVDRLNNAPQSDTIEATILIAAVTAIVQLVFAAHDKAPPDTAKDALHEGIDAAWSQFWMIVAREGGVN